MKTIGSDHFFNQNKTTRLRVVLSPALLCAVDIYCARSLFRILGFKGDSVAFAKFVKGNIHKGRGVEEDIFISGLRGDEAKALVGYALDSSFHSESE